jgi:hypothetical protein
MEPEQDEIESDEDPMDLEVGEINNNSNEEEEGFQFHNGVEPGSNLPFDEGDVLLPPPEFGIQQMA